MDVNEIKGGKRREGSTSTDARESVDARESGRADQTGRRNRPMAAEPPRSLSGPTPEDWARLLRIDPSKLDLGPARDRALQRLTKPFALLILAVGYGMGVLLTCAGLDVARLTGTNAFGFFLLEAAYNGVALVVLSAPFWFGALATPTAAAYRQRAVQWITADDAERARTYLRMVEGEAGLIWRFVAERRHPAGNHERRAPVADFREQAGFSDAPKPRLVGMIPREGEEATMEAMLKASWTGDLSAIDLDLYREAVEALQHHAVHVPTGLPHGERPAGVNRSAERPYAETVATAGNEPVAKNSDRPGPEVNFSDDGARGFSGTFRMTKTKQ